tara:strand:- start:274 stop:477 length:204 start_codon:yes stop_codon:yes gene_type:complete
MSFTYVFDIKVNKEVVETMTTDDMSKGQDWASSNTLVGDLVVVSEAYKGADGELEVTDHVTSYYIDS